MKLISVQAFDTKNSCEILIHVIRIDKSLNMYTD